MHLIESLQSQPTSINILEEYILWIISFIHKSDKKLLLLKNSKYQFTIDAFLEQAATFKQNLIQAYQNEKQIGELIRSKMIRVDVTDESVSFD